jgi:hypothetical protein
MPAQHAMQRKGALQDYINALLKLPPQISACAHVKTFFSINDEDISPPTEEELQQRAPNVLDKAARLVTSTNCTQKGGSDTPGLFGVAYHCESFAGQI